MQKEMCIKSYRLYIQKEVEKMMDVYIRDMMPENNMDWMPELMCDMEASEEELMRQVMEYDFACYDIRLYLDTHKNDQKALFLYKNCVETANSLRKAYEGKYGPIVASSSDDCIPFKWVVGKWPWEKSATEI